MLFLRPSVILVSNFLTELRGEYGWSKLNYFTDFPVAKELVRDNVERVKYKKTSHKEFVKKYERPSVPVVIVGAQENWKAAYKWNLEVLCVFAVEVLFVSYANASNHCLKAYSNCVFYVYQKLPLPHNELSKLLCLVSYVIPNCSRLIKEPNICVELQTSSFVSTVQVETLNSFPVIHSITSGVYG